MIVSRCCKDYLTVVQDHYVCEKCNLHCDAVLSLSWTDEEGHDDKRIDGKAKEIID
jgi:hypothetical protein